MAGKLTISTLNDDTGVLATQNGMTGIAKAWVNFTGSGTIAAQFNVSSITKNGSGDYTVNFTTALPDANYSAVVSPISGIRAMIITTNTLAAGSFKIQINYINFPGSNLPTIDSDCSVAVFR